MHVVIPAQNFRTAKSRLADVWSNTQRAENARWMLAGILRSLSACATSCTVTVLSDDADVRAFAESLGARGRKDRPDVVGHGAQLRAFADTLADDDSLLVLMSDLPLMNACAMENLLADCQNADVVLAPDRLRMGTNAAYFRSRTHRALHFGHADSFLRHQRAQGAYAHCVIHESPHTQLDLDSAEDLHVLQQWQRAHRPHDEELARCLWGSHA